MNQKRVSHWRLSRSMALTIRAMWAGQARALNICAGNQPSLFDDLVDTEFQVKNEGRFPGLKTG